MRLSPQRRVPSVGRGSSRSGPKKPLKSGRGGGIRTPDILLPKQARYQAALRPVVDRGRVGQRLLCRSPRMRRSDYPTSGSHRAPGTAVVVERPPGHALAPGEAVAAGGFAGTLAVSDDPGQRPHDGRAGRTAAPGAAHARKSRVRVAAGGRPCGRPRDSRHTRRSAAHRARRERSVAAGSRTFLDRHQRPSRSAARRGHGPAADSRRAIEARKTAHLIARWSRRTAWDVR